MRVRERDDARVQILRLRPCEPRRAIGAHRHLEKSRAQRLVERGHVIVRRLRIHGRDADPTFGQLVLVEPSRGEQLQRRLLDVALGAIELLEEQDARAVAREHVRERVFGAPVANDGQADEIRRLEQAQIEDGGRDAEIARDAPHDLALADAGRPFEEHGAPRPIRHREDALEPRPHRHRERTKRVAACLVSMTRVSLLSRSTQGVSTTALSKLIDQSRFVVSV